jgi:hypothetical protein
MGLQQLTARVFSVTYITEVMGFRDLKRFERKNGIQKVQPGRVCRTT